MCVATGRLTSKVGSGLKKDCPCGREWCAPACGQPCKQRNNMATLILTAPMLMTIAATICIMYIRMLRMTRPSSKAVTWGQCGSKEWRGQWRCFVHMYMDKNIYGAYCIALSTRCAALCMSLLAMHAPACTPRSRRHGDGRWPPHHTCAAPPCCL